MAKAILRTSTTAEGIRCVVVVFDSWEDTFPLRVLDLKYPRQDDGRYQYLHPLVQAVSHVDPEVALIEGYAQLYSYEALGAKLHEATGVPVIGMTDVKDREGDLCSFAIVRGGSLRPWYITTAGYDLRGAAEGLMRMKGPQVPTLVSLAETRVRGLSS